MSTFLTASNLFQVEVTDTIDAHHLNLPRKRQKLRQETSKLREESGRYAGIRIRRGNVYDVKKKSILVDGQFTFSSLESEDNIKRKVIDIMKRADSSFGSLETSDLKFDVAKL